MRRTPNYSCACVVPLRSQSGCSRLSQHFLKGRRAGSLLVVALAGAAERGSHPTTTTCQQRPALAMIDC
jgi:hypothetical protein